MYGFCDASALAYATSVYLVEDSNGRKSSSFIVSKTRVSFLKFQTIPRLELLLPVLLARLVMKVITSLSNKLEEPRCITDSQVVLFLDKGYWKPFVQNQVNGN